MATHRGDEETTGLGIVLIRLNNDLLAMHVIYFLIGEQPQEGFLSIGGWYREPSCDLIH